MSIIRLKTLARKDLAELAIDFGVEVADTMDDAALRDAVRAAVLADLDVMERDGLMAFAASANFPHAANIKEETLRNKLKAELDADAEPETTPAPKAALKNIEAWGSELFIPSWQYAAAVKSQGWKQGKQVSEAEFKNALTALKTRRIG